MAIDELQSLGQSVELGQSAARMVLQAALRLAKVCAESGREQYSLDGFDHAARHRAPRPQYVLRRLDGRRVFRRSGSGKSSVPRLGTISDAGRWTLHVRFFVPSGREHHRRARLQRRARDRRVAGHEAMVEAGGLP